MLKKFYLWSYFKTQEIVNLFNIYTYTYFLYLEILLLQAILSEYMKFSSVFKKRERGVRKN